VQAARKPPFSLATKIGKYATALHLKNKNPTRFILRRISQRFTADCRNTSAKAKLAGSTISENTGDLSPRLQQQYVAEKSTT
jgi:hypothetical protein